VVLDEKAVELPRKWTKGRLIFVNSMSDLFHDEVPVEFIERVFDVMRTTPQHTYQVLTKRAERLEAVGSRLRWPPNVWMGVSVESQDYWWRVDHLRATGAAVRFLSLEPLLGPIEGNDLSGIDWVIAGGESGPGSRPVQPDWVRSIRDACQDQAVAFHFKQWGGTNKKASGRVLDRRTWDEMPARHQGPQRLTASASLA
jgi:protein gp37